jgi:hypothetical protein
MGHGRRIGILNMDHTEENAPGPDARANRREQIPLQIKGNTDQIECAGLDLKVMFLQVSPAYLHGEARGARAQYAKSRYRGVHGGNVPSKAGEEQGVTAWAAGKIERPAWRPPGDEVYQER